MVEDEDFRFCEWCWLPPMECVCGFTPEDFVTPSKMEKYIPLAQVEQLIDEMERSSDIYWIWKIFRDFKSKLSSLPTEESPLPKPPLQ